MKTEEKKKKLTLKIHCLEISLTKKNEHILRTIHSIPKPLPKPLPKHSLNILYGLRPEEVNVLFINLYT